MAGGRGRYFARVAAAAMLAVLGTAPIAAAPSAKLVPCLACHGATGQSELPLVPSLGAQPPKYLLIQLFMFREGLRAAAPMNTLIKGWSDAELQEAADFLASLPAPRPPAGAVDAARLSRAAATVAENHCNICHRPDFAGDDNVPRLADQREDYLLKALRDYKSGARRGYDATMAEVLQPIGDGAIVDLAYYLSHFSTARRR